MSTLERSTRKVAKRSRAAAKTAGHIARDAAVVAGKAGKAGLDAVTTRAAGLKKGIKRAAKARQRRKQAKVAAVVVGAAGLTALGVALAGRSRKR